VRRHDVSPDRPDEGRIVIFTAAAVTAFAAAVAVFLTGLPIPIQHSPEAAPPAPQESGPLHGTAPLSPPVVPAPARPAGHPAAPRRYDPQAHHDPQDDTALTRNPGRFPQIAGIGCPDNQGDGFNPAGGPPGAGWTETGGGSTGNGCDGAAVQTQDPPGKPTASSFTWYFTPGASVPARRAPDAPHSRTESP
jgi:hypothetical protein